MKKRILLICTFCIFVFSVCKSQGIRYTYYLDADLNSTERSKAVILGKGIKENDLFKLDCYSITGGILYLTLHFSDSTLANIEGPYISYHLNGKPEKQGNYVFNNKDSIWQEWDSLGRKTDSTIYKQGKAYITSTFKYHENGVLSYYTIKDSLLDTYHTISYDDHAVINEEVIFKGQKGIFKTYTGAGIRTDSLFTREEVEASFPGGDRGWSNYLSRNLNASVPVDNKAPNGTYQVIVKFIVKKDGSVDDVFAETYFGYGMEKEVIKIIKNGPKWIPAVQYGRKVNAYRRQPVTFVVSGG